MFIIRQLMQAMACQAVQMCRAGQKERSDVCQHRYSVQVLENRLVITPAYITKA